MTHYLVEIFWSDEDEGYIATVPDLPGCSAWGQTREEAAKEIEDAQAAWIEACQASGEPVPAGKFSVQTMRKIVHAKVVGNTVVRLNFSDGSAGDYDLRDLIERDTVMTRPLSDPAFFHRCFLELGALCWPNGFELSASSLYRKLTEQGEISRAHRA